MAHFDRLSPIPTLALLLLCAPAFANSSGIVGRSGKQGESCSGHHSGGVAPVVRLEGPSIVAAGALATFRVTVQSESPNQIAAGLNVAASGGELGTVAGQSTQLELFDDGTSATNELTHTQPRRNDASATASWLFTWRAPPAPATATLFAAGNSVDDFGNMEGDRAATTRLDVEVGCLGSCNGDSQVDIDELIVAVRLALGDGTAACPLADGNGDGMVQVQELVGALQHSLHGCQ
jgi:hypothetical protein